MLRPRPVRSGLLSGLDQLPNHDQLVAARILHYPLVLGEGMGAMLCEEATLASQFAEISAAMFPDPAAAARFGLVFESRTVAEQRSRAEQPRHRDCLQLTVGNTVVGWMVGEQIGNAPYAVRSLAVLPPWRGHALGRRLLAALCPYLESCGYQSFTCELPPAYTMMMVALLTSGFRCLGLGQDEQLGITAKLECYLGDEHLSYFRSLYPCRSRSNANRVKKRRRS